jgi:hypothetical protein
MGQIDSRAIGRPIGNGIKGNLKGNLLAGGALWLPTGLFLPVYAGSDSPQQASMRWS